MIKILSIAAILIVVGLATLGLLSVIEYIRWQMNIKKQDAAIQQFKEDNEDFLNELEDFLNKQDKKKITLLG